MNTKKGALIPDTSKLDPVITALFFTKACQTADHPNAGFFVSFFT